MELGITLNIPDGLENDFISVLAKEMAKTGATPKSTQNIPWISEAEALNILQLTNKDYLRQQATLHGIATRKRGQRYYYKNADINTYIENGEPNY